MAIRQIFKNDAECLYKKCRPVERFDKKLSDLIDDMADTMYEADGVGLAAPQVGILRRVFVIDCGDGLVEMVNPEIIETSGEQGASCFTIVHRKDDVLMNKGSACNVSRLMDLAELVAMCYVHGLKTRSNFSLKLSPLTT